MHLFPSVQQRLPLVFLLNSIQALNVHGKSKIEIPVLLLLLSSWLICLHNDNQDFIKRLLPKILLVLSGK